MATISHLRKEKRRAYSKNNLKDVANICNLLGSELVENGEYDLALEEHKEEASLFEGLNDPIGVAIAHRRIGEVYSELSEWDKALEHQKKHLSLAIKCKDLVEEQRAHATIGRTHMQRSEVASLEENRDLDISALKESENSFLKALDTCQKIGGEIDSKELGQMRCRIYHNIGLVLDLRGETADAIKFVSQALELCKEYDFTEDAYRSYSELSKMHLKIDKISKALEEAQLSLKYSTKLQNKRYFIDAYQLIGQIHLANDDFLAAKKAFYKAYKTNHSNKNLKACVEKNLKYIVMVCLYRDEISKPETDDELRLKYLDKIGDTCANFGLHKQAISFYEKRLELAIKTKEVSFLAPIYTSLAQTYKDMKNYERAEEYFKKELTIHLNKNPKEAVATLIEIAKLSEELGKNLDKISSYYEQALTISENSNLIKLQGIILKSFLTVSIISCEKKEELKSKLSGIQAILGLDENENLELSEEEEESDDEIDLEHFQFSDSDEEEISKDCRIRRANNGIQLKKNAIGESPLHQAVIKGNISMVKRLIENNHPINIRDNSGWLPIHEACNWGHLDIAEMLIYAGAWVNDRGGKECSGTTPLHDAATNCHFEIVKLLVENGASVLAKNDNSDTPLECMVKFVHKNNLSDEDLQILVNVQNYLMKRMEMAGFKISTSLKTKILQSQSSLSTMKREKYYAVDDLQEDYQDETDSFPPDDELFPFGKIIAEKAIDTATATYKDAINNVGSHSKKVDGPISLRTSKDKTSLIPEEEYVTDDWLIDDLETGKKRKRVEKLEFEYKEESRRKTSPEIGSRLSKRKTKQPKLSNIFKKNSRPNQSYFDDEFLQNMTIESDDENLISSPSIKSASSKNLSMKNEVLSVSPLRLHVRILNKKLLVPVAPVAQSHTIGWLESEISRRYYQLAGVKLNLKLCTENDEVLNPDDNINLVLSSDNCKVHASVTGIKDLPSISARYSETCNFLGINHLLEVTRVLRDCESSGNLNLSKTYLKKEKDLQAVFTSIQHQNIQMLNLSNCRLEDIGMMNLIQALSSLSLLERLEAEASSITTESFENLVVLLKDEQSTLKKLTHINLSYNDFSKVSFTLFLQLFSVSSLLKIKLVSCDLYFSIPTTETYASNINCLHLDDNVLSLKALSTIVSICPYLTRLSIHNCLTFKDSSEGPSLGTTLSVILGSGNECLMEYLDISSCNVTNEDVNMISSYLYRCSVMNSLHLDMNTHISANSILNLLNEINQIHSHVPLKELYLHGIESLARDNDFSTNMSKIIEKKTLSQFPFVTLSVPNSESNEIIAHSWQKVYKEKALIKSLSKVMFLNLKISS